MEKNPQERTLLGIVFNRVETSPLFPILTVTVGFGIAPNQPLVGARGLYRRYGIPPVPKSVLSFKALVSLLDFFSFQAVKIQLRSFGNVVTSNM